MQPAFSNNFIDYGELRQRIAAIKPIDYTRNRNFLDGDVTRLGPFITHGVISGSDLARQALIDHDVSKVEKFLFQLAWREFFHRVWQHRGDEIFDDLKRPQPNAAHTEIPTAVVRGETGISVLDNAISTLQETGSMHNHARMWVAAVVCNIARTRWQAGARWLYYHLLDGDLASNCLSWQWIAGSFSNRAYIANQDNLNKYSRTRQAGTFLDQDYPDLANARIPRQLDDRTAPDFSNAFPASTLRAGLDREESVLLYHPFGLDPRWRKDDERRRVLVIEPDAYAEWPLGPKRWQFIAHWARQIQDTEIYVGSIESLVGSDNGIDIISREYPATRHWPGRKEPRDWLFPELTAEFPSFFKFWNRARKSL